MNTEVAPPVPHAPEPSKKETALVVWLVFMLLGGGLLALYYARIGYLPDIEWHFTLVYVAVVSFIGGAYALLQSLAIFLPGYIWSEAIICDSHIIGAFCYAEHDKHQPSVVKREPSVFRMFQYIGLPFLACLVVSHVVLPWGPWPYVWATIVLLAGGSAYVWWVFSRLINKREGRARSGDEGRIEKRERVSRLWKYVFWFDLSVLLSQIATLLIYYLSGHPTGSTYAKITAVCICVVLISNHVVAVRFWENHRQAIGASLAASLLLLVAADHFTNFPQKIMTLYGFGGSHKIDLLVNGDGANTVEKLGLPGRGCAGEARDKLCGVEILSDIGSEYLIKLGDEKAYTVFTLPKSMVISHAESCPNPYTAQPCAPE
jgi:hypothetical protein